MGLLIIARIINSPISIQSANYTFQMNSCPLDT